MLFAVTDERLCFRYTDSTVPLLSISKIPASSHLLQLHRPLCVGPGRKPRSPFSRVAAHFICLKIPDMAKSGVQYWLGLNDRATEGIYVWNDDTVAVS